MRLQERFLGWRLAQALWLTMLAALQLRLLAQRFQWHLRLALSALLPCAICDLCGAGAVERSMSV